MERQVLRTGHGLHSPCVLFYKKSIRVKTKLLWLKSEGGLLDNENAGGNLRTNSLFVVFLAWKDAVTGKEVRGYLHNTILMCFFFLKRNVI